MVTPPLCELLAQKLNVHALPARRGTAHRDGYLRRTPRIAVLRWQVVDACGADSRFHVFEALGNYRRRVAGRDRAWNAKHLDRKAVDVEQSEVEFNNLTYERCDVTPPSLSAICGLNTICSSCRMRRSCSST